MAKISKDVIAKMEKGAICKAVTGDYVIYKRSWLMEHIEQEYVLQKSARDFNKSVMHRKELLSQLKNEVERIKDVNQLKGEIEKWQKDTE